MSKNENQAPQVIPMYQTSTAADGSTKSIRVRPLTYALLAWVKNCGYKDSIEISDDGCSSQYAFTVDSLDGSFQYQCYFNAYETQGLLTFCAYYLEDSVPEDLLSDAYGLMIETNLTLNVGQIQLVGDDEAKTLRYFSSVPLNGIASDDPQYSGPYQIHPQIVGNLFDEGFREINGCIDAFIKLIDRE